MHPRKFPILGPVATWSLRTATVATLVGVYQFNTNDVGELSPLPFVASSLADTQSIGLTELIAKVWGA